MGHGHHEPYTIPDYKIYKVADVPLLKATEKALAAHGLKDPWLRNEVWRYNETQFGTEKFRKGKLFLRGFRNGLIAAVITVGIGMALDSGSSHGHGHGDGHGKDH